MKSTTEPRPGRGLKDRHEDAGDTVVVIHIGLWVLLALAVALRVWKISDKHLWLDEAWSWELARGSVSRLVAQTAADVHPPLYYLLLKLWIWVFGDSLAALRSLSVVCSVAALYLLFRLVEGAMPRVVCYAVLLWCALSPHALFYAQEARMYAPATAAVLGACLAYRRWIESGGARRSALVLYATSAVIALYLHYFTALAIAAIWLHFVVVGARTAGAGRTFAPWKAWLVAHTGVAIAYTPWITTAVKQLTPGQDWRQPVTIGELRTYALELLCRLTFGYYQVPNFNLPMWQILLAGGVLAVGGVCLVAAIIRRSRDERDVFFASIAYVPVLIALALLPLSGWMDSAKYVPYASPLLVAAAARGWTRTGLAPWLVAGVLCAGILGLLPAVRVYYEASWKDSDVRPIVAYLLAHARHGPDAASDPVFVAPGPMAMITRYYSRDAITYHEVDDPDTDLGSLGKGSSTDGHQVWAVVDHRWPKFNELDQNARLQPVDVPVNGPFLIRLFRLVPQ